MSALCTSLLRLCPVPRPWSSFSGRWARRVTPQVPARRGASRRSDHPQGWPDASGGRQRLFYALKVPEDVAAELAQAQSKLRGNWRRVEPSQLHLTLAYLPGVLPQHLDDLKRLGTAAARSAAPLDIRLRGTGYFPNEGSPRVWFVKAEAEGLDALAQALRSGTEGLGLETDDQAFRAHVTLARKKGPAPRLPPLVFEDTSWTAGHVSLVRSVLRKTGPIYQTVSRFELRGAPLAAPAPDPTTAPEAAPEAQENS